MAGPSTAERTKKVKYDWAFNRSKHKKLVKYDWAFDTSAWLFLLTITWTLVYPQGQCTPGKEVDGGKYDWALISAIQEHFEVFI